MAVRPPGDGEADHLALDMDTTVAVMGVQMPARRGESMPEGAGGDTAFAAPRAGATELIGPRQLAKGKPGGPPCCHRFSWASSVVSAP